MTVIPQIHHQETLAFDFTDVKSRQKKDSIASRTVRIVVQIKV